MRKTIPTVAWGSWLGAAALYGLPTGTSGVSKEAQSIDARVQEVRSSGERSVALFGPKTQALSELDSLSKSSELEDAPNDASVLEAKSLIRALPDDAPMPEFSVDSDGAVLLDWIRSKRRMLSVSAAGRGRLAYAWLDGTDKGHGVAKFDGSRVPAAIVSLIKEIMDVGSSVRAA